MAAAYTFTLTSARSRLGELINRARFGRDRVVITEHGTPVAAIISVEELAEMQEALDAADIAAAVAVKSAGRPGISHDLVMAAMDALDAADEAATPELAQAILAPHASVLAQAAALSMRSMRLTGRFASSPSDL